MGIGAILEPLIVVTLLFGGAWINRDTSRTLRHRREGSSSSSIRGKADLETTSLSSRSSSPVSLDSDAYLTRERQLKLLSWSKVVETPDTVVFQDRFLSRILLKFPFLVEAWYWALIYWVYQLGRAFTALTIVEGTVNVARKHALQIIAVERQIGIFWEIPIQRFFMQYPTLMRYINWLYSFIHIPGTILFLVWLFWYTITSSRRLQHQFRLTPVSNDVLASGYNLYERRRRTMATCNLLAFVVFTLWPCMPPRLLSDPETTGENGDFARSFGFVDTVHGSDGAASVWTANKFCNQWAAMPSLHFGYSLLVGLTIATIPLSSERRRSVSWPIPLFNQSHPNLVPRLRTPSTTRIICLSLGVLYPFSILVAIVSTANHFILDAVAGAMICGIGWKSNDVLLNLLPVEDWFLYMLRIHKPSVDTSRTRNTSKSFLADFEKNKLVVSQHS